MLLLVVVTLSSCSHRLTVTLMHTLPGHEGEVISLAFSPDGSLLASGDTTGTIKLWRVADGGEVRTIKGHEGQVSFVAFSTDGTLIMTGGSDQMLKSWRVADGSAAWAFEYTGDLKAMLVSTSRMLLATSESPSGTIKLWEVLGRSQIRILKESTWKANPAFVAFTPDGRWLAISSSVGWQSTISLWKPEEDFVRGLPSGSRLFVDMFGPITFSPDGKLLAAVNFGSVILWKIEEGIIKDWPKFLTHASITYTLTFSSDGTLLALCDLDGLVRIWRVPSGEEVSSFMADGCPLAFAPNGQWLASGSMKQEQESSEAVIRVWKLNPP